MVGLIDVSKEIVFGSRLLGSPSRGWLGPGSWSGLPVVLDAPVSVLPGRPFFGDFLECSELLECYDFLECSDG